MTTLITNDTSTSTSEVWVYLICQKHNLNSSHIFVAGQFLVHNSLQQQKHSLMHHAYLRNIHELTLSYFIHEEKYLTLCILNHLTN